MPFTMPNFPVPNFQESNPFLSGAQIGQALTQQGMMFPQQLQNQILLNQINAAKAKYAMPMAEQELKTAQQQYAWNPRIWQSEIGLRGAQSNQANAQVPYLGAETSKINYELAHPGLMSSGAANELQGLIDIGIISPSSLRQGQQQKQQPSQAIPIENGQEQQPEHVAINPPSLNQQDQSGSMPFKTGNPMVDAIMNKQFANSMYQKKMTSGFNYVHAPVDAKNYMIAQLAGAGIDPSESVGLLTAGYTVPQILKSRGFDPNNAPEPDFLPTRGNVEQLKKRQAALKEVESLGNFIREGLGPYSRTFMNYSPLQISGALKGIDDESQAKFLAARGLAPEYNNVRLMLAQARTSKYSMQSIMDKSMTDISALRPFVSTKVWTRAQEIMDKKLSDSFDNASTIYSVGKRTSKTSSKNDDPLGIR